MQLTSVRTSKTDKALKSAFSDSVVFKKLNGVESAVMISDVLDFEYIIDDRKVHKGIKCNEEPTVFEIHERNGDKGNQ